MLNTSNLPSSTLKGLMHYILGGAQHLFSHGEKIFSEGSFFMAMHEALRKRIMLGWGEIKFHLDPEFRRNWDHQSNVYASVRMDIRAEHYKTPGRVKAAEFTQLFEAHNGLCANKRCQSVLITKGRYRFHWDHKIPFSRQGENTVENLQPLCPHCNRVKKTMTPAEFEIYPWKPGPDYHMKRLKEIEDTLKPIQWKNPTPESIAATKEYTRQAERALVVARSRLVVLAGRCA